MGYIIIHIYNQELIREGTMITTLMPHLRIGPYKEGVTIVQIQMQFYPIVRSWTLLL